MVIQSVVRQPEDDEAGEERGRHEGGRAGEHEGGRAGALADAIAVTDLVVTDVCVVQVQATG